jgi:hypothetical protein
MVHEVGRHPRRPDRDGHAVLELDVGRLEAPRDGGGAGEEELHRRVQARAHARRPRHHQRPRAAVELAVEHEEGDAAEVVHVEMREQHPADLGRVERHALETDERGGAAVEEDASLARAGQVQAGLEAAAAPNESPSRRSEA